eukprot:4162545-Amphidinium_carterae.1
MIWELGYTFWPGWNVMVGSESLKTWEIQPSFDLFAGRLQLGKSAFFGLSCVGAHGASVRGEQSSIVVAESNQRWWGMPNYRRDHEFGVRSSPYSSTSPSTDPHKPRISE